MIEIRLEKWPRGDVPLRLVPVTTRATIEELEAPCPILHPRRNDTISKVEQIRAGCNPLSEGPITIFDKSMLQGLSQDEACWFGNFYRANITPLFFVETLADLEKDVKSGRTPEQVVGNIASKTPVLGAHANVHHSELCFSDLVGESIAMERLPVVGGGRQFAAEGGRSGVSFGQPPELEALQRWQEERFREVERRFAARWRRMLSELDLEGVYQHVRRLGGGDVRVGTLQEAKAWSERFVRGDGRRYLTLKAAFELLGVPDDLAPRILRRWKTAGGPALPDFAPYAAYVLCVDLFFHLALGANLISRTRPSNRIDIAYLYYLPFCMVFVSNDKLHARTAPLFMTKDQIFLQGEKLKKDLTRLDEYYTGFSDEVKGKGIISFAPYPPLDGGYLTSELWDRFLPGWRPNARTPHNEEGYLKVMSALTPMIAAAKTARSGVGSLADADFVVVKRHVPTRMGKWRLLPPEVEEQAT